MGCKGFRLITRTCFPDDESKQWQDSVVENCVVFDVAFSSIFLKHLFILIPFRLFLTSKFVDDKGVDEMGVD